MACTVWPQLTTTLNITNLPLRARTHKHTYWHKRFSSLMGVGWTKSKVRHEYRGWQANYQMYSSFCIPTSEGKQKWESCRFHSSRYNDMGQQQKARASQGMEMDRVVNPVLSYSFIRWLFTFQASEDVMLLCWRCLFQLGITPLIIGTVGTPWCGNTTSIGLEISLSMLWITGLVHTATPDQMFRTSRWMSDLTSGNLSTTLHSPDIAGLPECSLL